ncbi:2'-deoxycytidine 5'-triphosphate deaminase [Methylobrevis pamukkalensis]|uniref:2'-deoxycytidine 5'-triphosphate deaminase n=1 Tax=Methylobrevis pamukkalensis TaxID=1439726 RepID=A0A1E3H2G8_9HYPH|nr:2'-deoxycytidine 5'-triphosphate deaminase [Methylobrevis pamukkalensis]
MSVTDKLERLRLHTIDLREGAVLETGCVYLVPVLETFALPAGVSASANPKSSTGRLDVFTRVITDGGHSFDTIPVGYHGPLYVEVSPRTFPVLVRTGSRLSQVRFRAGSARLDDTELADLHAVTPLVDTDPARFEDGLTLSIDLMREGTGALLGYRAKRHTGVIDVDRKAAFEVLDFWEPIHARGAPSLILDPGEFYILASREAVHVPPDTAARWSPSTRWWANSASTTPASSTPASAMPPPAAPARAPCWRCARARCPSSSTTARPSAASSTRRCRPAPTRSTAWASAPTTRRRA